MESTVMKTGSVASVNHQSCIPLRDHPGQQQQLSPDLASRMGWMRYWAIIPLVFANPLMAEAAPTANSNWPGPNTKNLVKAETTKTPKSSPSDLLILTWGPAEDLHTQQLTLETVPVPEATVPLNTEPMVTEASELLPKTSEVAFLEPPVTPASSISAPELTAQATDTADPIPWRFSFEPYFYLPFGANGDITVRGVEAPINAGIGDIFDAIVNDLNFAAFGRVEAWNGPWGILFDGTYMNVGTGQTAVIGVPPDLQLEGLPPQVTIDAAVGTSYTKFDLAGGYRFGDGNLPNAFRTADTEFDLGPFFFDAIAGLRLYFFNNDLVLTDDLGGRYEFSQSRTIAEPMIGGRARWNLSNNLAVLTGASLSGFGIGGLTFSVDGYAGVDWLFSGNTSLMASYRLTYVDYSSGSSGLNLFTHGPMVGVKFRY
jgi:hypothetical protein